MSGPRYNPPNGRRGFIGRDALAVMAYQLWCSRTGRWGGSEETHNDWLALSKQERKRWGQIALAQQADYAAMTQAERDEHDRESRKRQLAQNDLEYVRLRAKGEAP